MERVPFEEVEDGLPAQESFANPVSDEGSALVLRLEIDQRPEKRARLTFVCESTDLRGSGLSIRSKRRAR